jgi:L-ascorbate metabolism protein UlaG (beta-lactamase superfamily)
MHPRTFASGRSTAPSCQSSSGATSGSRAAAFTLATARGSVSRGRGVHLREIDGSALTPDDIAPVDVVLLSHDHHKDHLDNE